MACYSLVDATLFWLAELSLVFSGRVLRFYVRFLSWIRCSDDAKVYNGCCFQLIADYWIYVYFTHLVQGIH